MDVAGTIDRHVKADVVVGAAEGGGPLMDARRVEFGDKPVRLAVGGDVPGPEINGVSEVAGDVDVAGTIHGHPIADVGSGSAEGGGPLMGARRVEFGDKPVR